MSIQVHEMNNLPMLTVPNVFLVGLCGHAHSGKGTVAEYLTDKYENIWSLAFADALKDAAAAAFGIPVAHFYEEEFKEIPHPYWKVSPRQIAQFIGTEMFRDLIGNLIPGVGKDFWVHRLCSILNGETQSEIYVPAEEQEIYIIPDVRFPNEVNFIKQNGGIIINLSRLEADGNVGIAGHASENMNFIQSAERSFYVDNNSTKEELFGKIEAILFEHSHVFPISN